MTITAVVDRFYKGNAILLSDEIGLEINLPAKVVKGIYKKGEIIELKLGVVKDNMGLQWEIKGKRNKQVIK